MRNWTDGREKKIRFLQNDQIIVCFFNDDIVFYVMKGQFIVAQKMITPKNYFANEFRKNLQYKTGIEEMSFEDFQKNFLKSSSMTILYEFLEIKIILKSHKKNKIRLKNTKIPRIKLLQ